MKKIITILAITFLCSFQNKWTDASKATRGNNLTITPQEYWVLVGTVNDFIELNKVIDKVPDSDTMKKKIRNWIDTKLQRLRTVKQ